MALSTGPATEVELFISCRQLVDKDVFSKSDPIVVVQESLDGTKWTEVRKTKCYEYIIVEVLHIYEEL